MYQQVRGIQLSWLSEVIAAKVAKRLPVVLTGVEVQTTMIYTHVLNRGGRGVVSPLDT